MLVDYERVLLDLKRFIAAKPHHGQRELSVVIAGLEVKHAIEEGLPERTLRLYGLEFFEEAIASRRTPPSQGGRVPAADGDQVRASRGDSTPQSEEDSHARHRNGRAEGGHAPSRSGSERVVSLASRS